MFFTIAEHECLRIGIPSDHDDNIIALTAQDIGIALAIGEVGMLVDEREFAVMLKPAPFT